tara:strand:+ start:3519 stop:4112 length:594 start_codon:yes stop_codon:yes gene_type:complete
MNLTNEYYYFTEAIDKKTCNKIIKAGKKDFGEATVGHSGEGIVDKQIRTSKTAWSNDQWIYDLIWPYMETANAQSGWEYDIKAAESVQITRYETGGFYNFHKDGESDNLGAYNSPQNLFTHGRVRKLSMSIILNDDYEGGGFEFATMGNGASTIYTPDFNKLGSIIVFPSFLAHRVEPVTKGTRYAAVCWFLGPPFK